MRLKMSLIDLLKNICERHEVEFFGVVGLESEPSYQHFEAWIDEKKHAGMQFLERYKDLRQNPAKIEPHLPNAIVLGFNYFQGDRYISPKNNVSSRVAQYARFKDYHKLLKKKSDSIMRDFFHESGVSPCEFRALIDSAPVLERAIAAKSGRGFIGKNTVFIDPEKGSYFLLFEILTAIDFPLSISKIVDPKVRGKDGGCGSCTRCKIYCPTDALSEDYVLDARKCIAYYTIEHRGTIPVEYWKYLRLYYFGCDICQLVCPYNRKAQINKSIDVRISEDIDLYDVALMDERQYIEWFAGTPMTRAKRVGLIRNALIYLVVTEDPRLESAINIIRGMDPLVDDTIKQIPAFRSLSSPS